MCEAVHTTVRLLSALGLCPWSLKDFPTKALHSVLDEPVENFLHIISFFSAILINLIALYCKKQSSQETRKYRWSSSWVWWIQAPFLHLAYFKRSDLIANRRWRVPASKFSSYVFSFVACIFELPHCCLWFRWISEILNKTTEQFTFPDKKIFHLNVFNLNIWVFYAKQEESVAWVTVATSTGNSSTQFNQKSLPRNRQHLFPDQVGCQNILCYHLVWQHHQCWLRPALKIYCGTSWSVSTFPSQCCSAIQNLTLQECWAV